MIWKKFNDVFVISIIIWRWFVKRKIKTHKDNRAIEGRVIDFQSGSNEEWKSYLFVWLLHRVFWCSFARHKALCRLILPLPPGNICTAYLQAVSKRYWYFLARSYTATVKKPPRKTLITLNNSMCTVESRCLGNCVSVFVLLLHLTSTIAIRVVNSTPLLCTAPKLLNNIRRT